MSVYTYVCMYVFKDRRIPLCLSSLPLPRLSLSDLAHCSVTESVTPRQEVRERGGGGREEGEGEWEFVQ